VLVAPYFGCLCVSLSRRFFVWMMEAWTLEMTAALFSSSCCMETSWIMPFHHGKWVSRFETKRKHLFLVVFGTSMMILQ
jgi:hypothetical protein